MAIEQSRRTFQPSLSTVEPSGERPGKYYLIGTKYCILAIIYATVSRTCDYYILLVLEPSLYVPEGSMHINRECVNLELVETAGT